MKCSNLFYKFKNSIKRINNERVGMEFLIPITKFVTFLGTVPKSSLLSTSNIGIQVEALTHAFKMHKKNKQRSQQ